MTETSENVGIYNLATGQALTKKSLEKNLHLSEESKLFDDTTTIKLAIASDWGSGTWESAAVASLIKATNPDYTLHLGDVYYEAMEDEIKPNLMGQPPNDRQIGVTWPTGKLGTFHINGNHEMLSLGNGYFDFLLPTFKQKASYMCLENNYWRVIGLDSGYNSYNVFKRIAAIDELVSKLDVID